MDDHLSLRNLSIQPSSCYLHVVVGAVPSLSCTEIARTGGGDEVVTLPSLKLNSFRRRREGSEGDGEEPLSGGLIAERNNGGVLREDPTGIILFLVHVVDNVSLHALNKEIFHF